MLFSVKRSRTARVAAAGIAVMALMPFAASSGSAHSTTEYVKVYPPLAGTSTWVKYGSQPSSHHVVYSNWGYTNDWAVDIYAPPGRAILSPFGSKASNGNAMEIKVVGKRAGCATGNLADGGYVLTLEAKNKATGVVLGRANVMHVNKPTVSVGAVVSPYQTLGYTSRFRYSSCYQVNGDAGTHVHLEVINKHRYSCYVARSGGSTMGTDTMIGKVGVHYSGRQKAC